jgi:hypothetical protein
VPRRKKQAGPNTNGGLCMCGCGERTRIQGWTDRAAGLVKGQHRRFIDHHHKRKGPNPARHEGKTSVLRLIYKGKPMECLVDKKDYHLVKDSRWSVAKTNGIFYATRNPGPPYLMHQLILPGVPEVDHRSRNGLDNRRSNLRPATRSQNNMNHKRRKGVRSRFKGLYYFPKNKRWYARIRVNGKVISLGGSRSESTAARLYDEAAKKYYGEFARGNFFRRRKI